MLKLKNTLNGEVEELIPHSGKTVQMYVCGVTPYDNCHLGHARTFVSFDVMKRWMHECGLKVNHIQNVTDIDDKIIKRAQERKVMPLELSDKFDKKSRKEFEQLNILAPNVMPKISEHIPQTLAMIQKLLDKKAAYITDTGVYFEISKFAKYGKLSGQNLEKIKAGARIEVDEKKKNPADFALWKFEETAGATYDSPWGRGRPGWHIECSSMSMHCTKGKPLDLHCGARDLIFPHHENEIAQSEGAGYVPFSHMWVHTGFLTVNGEKMAKSLGNFITIEDALKKWDANTLRLFFSLTHYSSPIDFSETAIESAKNVLENVKRNLSIMHGEGENENRKEEGELENRINAYLDDFASNMDKDLDTPSAISALVLASKEIARARADGKCSKKEMQKLAGKIREKFEVIGIDIKSGEEQKTIKEGKMNEKEIQSLIKEREEARKKKDFKKSDEIRDLLKKNGIVLEDSKDGIRWRYS
ncbi:MAG: cysteine--tRNA ligase [Candidatus Micrarchaeia archaeon]